MFSALVDWNSNELIVVAGQVKVKPERKEDFIALAQSLIAPSRAEVGVLSYSFYKDETQDNVFIFFEEWKNQAALDEHFQTSYFKEFCEKSPDLFIETPLIKIYQVGSFKIL